MKSNHTPEIRFSGFAKNWEQRKLLDTVEKVLDFRGKSPVKFGMKWGNSGYLVLSALNVKNGYIDKDVEAKYGDEALFERWMGKERLEKGDVVFTTEAPLGNVAQIPDDNLYILNQRAVAFKTSKEETDNNFLAQLLRSPVFQGILKANASGGTAKGIGMKEFAKINTFIPASVNEQVKIGNFLKQLDKTIVLYQQELSTLKQTKQGFLQKMFPKDGESLPKLRFPGFTGDWKHRSLSELVERVTRKNKKLESTLPLTISAQHGLVDQTTFFNKTVASSNLEGYYLLYKGEFSYNKSYSNGYPFGAVKRLEKYDKGVLSSLYICFRPLPHISSDFLTHYFVSTSWHKEISMISVEGACNHGLLNISVSDFFETRHLVPTFEEQKKIGEFLGKLDETIALHQQELEALQQTKKAFLQKMFV